MDGRNRRRLILISILHAHAASKVQREYVVSFLAKKKKKKRGIVQWREDGEDAAWRFRRRAMHPSLMIRHSEVARKMDRVRRYMIVQVSWVQAGTVTTERNDANDGMCFLVRGK